MDAMRRQAQLGIQTIHLMGIVPVPGTPLRGQFVIPAARRADRPLTGEDLCRGVIVVSTLPNIHKHACLSQIVDLEERGRALSEQLRIVHVSADHESHWQEVDQFHPNIQAAGYSLCSADAASREAFVTAFGVGVQGLAVADRAYQLALAWAKDRVQGKDATAPKGPSVPIIRHPDVRRMLMSMKSRVEAMRALAYVVAAMIDQAHRAPDEAARASAHAGVDLLIPILKAWCTETGIEVASTGIQVHGGMGFIEETGAAQYYRDAKILTIYEGTTAIQANDLVGRKTARDGGTAARAIAAQVQATEAALAASASADAQAVGRRLKAAREAFLDVVGFVAGQTKASPNAVFAGSVPYLMLSGNLMAGWQLGRALLVAEQRLAAGEDLAFMRAKVTTARFYADHILSRAPGIRDSIVDGAAGVTEMALDAF